MRDRCARWIIAWICSTLLALLLNAPAALAAAPPAWHLAAIGAQEAWRTSTGSGVTVAVIDSGVDAGHPDLDGAVLPGRSYVDTDAGEEPRLLALGSDPSPAYERAFAQADPVGHGTAVAGLIAGRASSGHPGVAPGAKILPVRVLDDENRYHDSAMVGQAVEWAVDNGADVINLSLGGHYDSRAFADAIDYAARHDVLVVACTGNQRRDGAEEPVWFPARIDNVLAVTGSDRTGERWPTAVTGSETDLAAPGADLAVPAAGGGHKQVTGTSFASAIVSGAAALVRAEHPKLSAAQVRLLLTETARGGDSALGAGLVDAGAALAADIGQLPEPQQVAAGSEPPSVGLSAVMSTAGGALLGAAALLLRGRRRHRPGAAASSGPR
ncbi:S8 family serine peptidase [Glycomyces buryatensis]|uniref:Type VII secretion-associated serine protease mycosin n=1 Tax=Glycomyces buryatensis TaxID=2570927 RepID=A0A4S8QF68_9ACTN|nr:S8 family serine peptidase [Glycomyces buryatensis]THV42321.1 type VII secretion-associated serine protease mycosin [Glycomyces buryatensis]